MVETIVNSVVDFFKNVVPAELIAFVVSLFPVLEIRGGMIAARILEIEFIKAFEFDTVFLRYRPCIITRTKIVGRIAALCTILLRININNIAF